MNSRDIILIKPTTNQALCPKNTSEYSTVKIATPEPALSGGEILRLRLRMTGSEEARNDMGGRLTTT